MTEILPVLYQDEYLVAVNKPSGLLVHRSDIDRHETRFALQIVRNQLGQHVFPMHRLDKPASGVLLFALNADIARLMTAQFTEHRVKKQYMAIVRGYTDLLGRVDYPLSHQFDKMTDKLADQDKPAQEAVTGYERLATVEVPFSVDRSPKSRYSLLKLTPETGRKHQIRRHLKHLSHPIIGDTTYGKAKHNHFFQQQYGVHRLLLAATELSCVHPVTTLPLLIKAPLSVEFNHLFEQFGWVNVV